MRSPPFRRAKSTQPRTSKHWSLVPGGGGSQAGVTVIELLAIVSVLGTLVLVATAGMGSTRQSAGAPGCLNNLRQLGQAWRMYAEDNRGLLAPNQQRLGSSAVATWVGGWLDSSGSPDNTNTDLLMNHSRYPYAAYLGPYVRRAGVFHCPADESAVRVGGQYLRRVRSVSMDGLVGGIDLWRANGSVRCGFTNVAQPSTPAGLAVILDEREDSINDGSFAVSGSPGVFSSQPAVRHGRAGGLCFADGHSEIHFWKDPRTWGLSSSQPGWPSVSTTNLDAAWLQAHSGWNIWKRYL